MIQSSWDDRGQTEGATATITDTAQQVLTTISMPNDGYLNGANANVTLTIQPATATTINAANVMQYHCDLLFGACFIGFWLCLSAVISSFYPLITDANGVSLPYHQRLNLHLQIRP